MYWRAGRVGDSRDRHQSVVAVGFELYSGRERTKRLTRGHVQNIKDALAAIPYFQYFASITFTLTIRAIHRHVCKDCMSISRCPSPLHVSQRPPSTLIAEVTRPCSCEFSPPTYPRTLPNGIECFDIGYRVGSRRSPDRTLINQQNIIKLTVTEHLIERQGFGAFFFFVFSPT